jgi:hypothetical protein
MRLPLYRVEIKSEWSCTSAPPVCVHGVGGKIVTFFERGMPVQERCAGYKTYLIPGVLTAWSRVLLEKLAGLQLIKIYPRFMEPEGLLLHS